MDSALGHYTISGFQIVHEAPVLFGLLLLGTDNKEIKNTNDHNHRHKTHNGIR